MSELVRASLEGVRELAKGDLAVGSVIETGMGVKVIPISRVHLGFATGGLDLGQKKLLSDKGFGAGGGSGISITPLAFVAISENGISVHSVDPSKSALERIVSLAEMAPELIEKLKDSLHKDQSEV